MTAPVTGALGALAIKHGRPPQGRPACAKCGERPTEARIVVSAKLADKTQKVVATKTRSLCGHCTAELFEAMVALLPEQGAGRAQRP